MASRKRALPNPLPDGFLLTDTEKTTWRLGKIIGQGGFGLIYLASQNVDTRVAEYEFVIKVEFHENGPLFSELKFYQRAAKPDAVQRWRKSRKLDFLGIPTYWGSGLAEHNGTRYRFMVMDRLGIDLQKVCNRNGGRLRKTMVLYLAQTMLNVLEYIHDNEYVHADIKAANLMLGHRDPEQVYLADYGLAYRYCPDGTHKDYKENPKKGHNGTMEYTSLDAHKGAAPSRRGDLQVLGFCLLHWLCGSLPWDSYLKNPSRVQEAKARLMEDLPGSVTQLSVRGASTDEVASLLLYVKALDYKERPDYQRLRELLASGGPVRLDLSGPGGEAAGASSARPSNPPARGKKAGQARGPSKAKPTVDSEEEDDGEAEERKPKPVAPRYIRGRPAAAPQTEQSTGTATRRSPRTRGAPAYVESDDEEEEEEDDEEEGGERPRPIEARYIRGPPVGPRPQPEQGKKAAKYKRCAAKTLDVAFAKEIKHGHSHKPGEADGGEKGGPGCRRQVVGLGRASPYQREGRGQTVGSLWGHGSSNEGRLPDPVLRKPWQRTGQGRHCRPDPYEADECEERKVKGHESKEEGSCGVGCYVAAALCVLLSLLVVVAVAGGA